MVLSFDSAHEDWEQMDGGLGKGWGSDWATAPPTPTLCYFFVNQEARPAFHWMCSRNPSNAETSSAFWTNAFFRRHIWRMPKYQHNWSAHSPTLVSIATASISLCNHAVCPWVWPTRQREPPLHLQDPAHSSSKPRREQIWFLPSGGSLIQLLHITRLQGRDWRAAVRGVNVRRWQESQGNVRVCFAAFAVLIFGRTLFNCSA